MGTATKRGRQFNSGGREVTGEVASGADLFWQGRNQKSCVCTPVHAPYLALLLHASSNLQIALQSRLEASARLTSGSIGSRCNALDPRRQTQLPFLPVGPVGERLHRASASALTSSSSLALGLSRIVLVPKYRPTCFGRLLHKLSNADALCLTLLCSKIVKKKH